jgi:hypothetical protein
MGAQTSPTNFGNPMDVFGKADATRAAMPNLFSTIQAVRANELERQTKQAAISKVLQDLVIQQKLAPIEMAYKQAQQQNLLSEMELNPAKKALVEAQTAAYGTTAQYQQDKLAVDRAKNERLLKQQQMLDRILGGGQSDGTDGTVGAVGGNLPPGSTIQVGGVRIPLNQRLTDSEQAAVSGSIAIEPVVDRIITSVDTIFVEPKTTKEKIARTARQAIADSDNTLLSSQDPELQSFQQELANLRRLIPFTDGGKQLTPFEAKRVFALLNTTGKNNKQIKKDIGAAVSIVKAKGGLSLGGRQAALNLKQSAPQDNSDLATMSDEELKKIAGGA